MKPDDDLIKRENVTLLPFALDRADVEMSLWSCLKLREIPRPSADSFDPHLLNKWSGPAFQTLFLI